MQLSQIKGIGLNTEKYLNELGINSAEDLVEYYPFKYEILENTDPKTIKDGDKIYADITFGMKVYTLSMFIAMAYAAKAGINISAETIIYSMKYSGTEEAKNVNTAKIYDLTSLFYLNAIAGEAAAGDKAGLDDLLKFIISR